MATLVESARQHSGLIEWSDITESAVKLAVDRFALLNGFPSRTIAYPFIAGLLRKWCYTDAEADRLITETLSRLDHYPGPGKFEATMARSATVLFYWGDGTDSEMDFPPQFIAELGWTGHPWDSFREFGGKRKSVPPRRLAIVGEHSEQRSFPNRAKYFADIFARLGWTAHTPEQYGGPEHRSTQKVLDGMPVRDKVLERLAVAISKRGLAVTTRYFPTD